MGATRSLREGDSSGQAMEATAGALLEADRRLTSPLRKYQFWRKVYMPGTLCANIVTTLREGQFWQIMEKV